MDTHTLMLPHRDEPLFTLSDAICMTALSGATIKRYEQQGLIFPIRSHRGTRLYRLRDLETAVQVYKARMARTGANGVRRPLAATVPSI